MYSAGRVDGWDMAASEQTADVLTMPDAEPQISKCLDDAWLDVLVSVEPTGAQTKLKDENRFHRIVVDCKRACTDN